MQTRPGHSTPPAWQPPGSRQSRPATPAGPAWSPWTWSPRLQVAVAGGLATLLVVSVALMAGLASSPAQPVTENAQTVTIAAAGSAAPGVIALPGLPPIDLSGLGNLLSGLTNSAPATTPPAAAPAAAPASVPGIPASSTVGDAVGSSVAVFASPGGAQTTSIPGTNSIGQKEAFLVVGQQPGWYQVELPIKPDGVTGWIEASSVTTRTDPYAIAVHQSTFTLDLYDSGQLTDSFPVAVGEPNTPTPNGNFFVWASQPWNRYPYAVGIFALSAFSPVLVNWPGGGRTGIHGWYDPGVVGHAASNGCVRMSGADFQVLLNAVPLGTPVQISQQ